MNLDRIEQGSSGSITVSLAAGGVPVDPAPDSATVAIARADGTAVASGSANDGGTGVFSFPYTPAHTALLDTWIATWTFTYQGQAQTRKTIHEIAGGFLCTIAELQPLFAGKTEPELRRIRTVAEQRLEQACGQAFVPRYALERVDGTGSTLLVLRWSRIRTLRSLTIDGTTVAPSAVSVASHVVDLSTAWPKGFGNVTVGYEHGQDFPGEDIREAAVLVARETYATTGENRVVRREADGQAVTYASPSSSSGFVDPLLRSIVRDHDLNVGIA